MRRFLQGLALGIFVTALLDAYLGGYFEDPTRASLQMERDAMQACMQGAGRTGCRMEIEDFIRYYELRDLLELPKTR